MIMMGKFIRQIWVKHLAASMFQQCCTGLFGNQESIILFSHIQCRFCKEKKMLHISTSEQFPKFQTHYTKPCGLQCIRTTALEKVVCSASILQRLQKRKIKIIHDSSDAETRKYQASFEKSSPI